MKPIKFQNWHLLMTSFYWQNQKKTCSIILILEQIDGEQEHKT
jgi:hypothetical protein